MDLYQNRIGINLSESKMQLVEVVNAGETFIIENADEVFYSEFIDFNGKETKIISLLKDALNEIVVKKPLKSKAAFFTLPQKLFKVVQIPVDNTLRESDLSEYLKWEISILFPDTLPDDYTYQYFPVHCSIDKLNDTVILAVVLKKHLMLVKNFCNQNKLELKFVDNVHIASDNLVLLEDGFSHGSIVGSIYIETDQVSISLIQNNKPVFYKNVTINSASDILPAIEEQLNANKYFHLNLEQLSAIYISGDKIPEAIENGIKERIGKKILNIDLENKFSFNPASTENKTTAETLSTYSAALGIACRNF